MKLMEQTTQLTGNIRLASTIFYVLSAFKLMGAFFGLRLLFMKSVPPPGTGGLRDMLTEHPTLVGFTLLIFYGCSFVLCILLARNIKRRRTWARNIGFAYSIFHVAGIFAVRIVGPILLLNGLLGFLALVGLYRANSSGEFELAEGTLQT
jgi:hypothetical protein